MVTARNIKIGKEGERVAQEMLLNKGYKILEKNFQNKYGEIDIIAQKKEEIIFVEVRSKTGHKFGSPEDTISQKKKKQIKRNALAYMAFNNVPNPYRVDIICIVFDNMMEVIRKKHYENITLF